MAKQITKDQHYAPKFYFKRFADEEGWLQVLDIRNGRLIKPKPFSGVCYAEFYYGINTGEADEASQDFEKFFKIIEDYFSSSYDQIVEDISSYKQLTFQQLDKLAWFLASMWIRSPQMRDQLNRTMADGMKQFMKLAASHPSFEENSIKTLSEEGVEATKEQLEDVRKSFIEKDYEIEFDNVHHLQFIVKCEEFRRWFIAKNWRIYLAKGKKKFTTSDVPVLDIFNEGKNFAEKIYTNHIMQRQQFFALSPEILIELTDPRIGKKVKRRVIDDAAVLEYNLIRARHSDQFCYSSTKTELEDMLPYYHGTPKPRGKA